MRGLAFVMLLLLPCVAGAEHPVVGGTFIQAWLVPQWSDARWQEEFAAMKEVGIDLIILQQTAQGEGDLLNTFYPSSLPYARQQPGYPDLVDALLRNAQTMGIRVFLGLNHHSAWDHNYANNPEWLTRQMEIGNAVAGELHQLYKEKYPETLVGWYWVWEIENLNFKGSQQQAVLAQALNLSLDYLTELDPSMPLMLSPFMNHRVSSVEEYRNLWVNVFSQTRFREGDIFAPQDSVGAGGTTLQNFTQWMKALREAVDTKPELVMWANAENFDQTDWTTRPVGHFVQQLQGSQPYVEGFITFAYPHYYSPHHIHPGFHQTYREYVQTGVVDTEPPTMPENLRGGILSGSQIFMVWDASQDNLGVAGYRIYRRGVEIGHVQVPRGRQVGRLESFMVDVNRREFSITFGVRAYDFAGNLSEMAEVTISNMEE